jgi:hypothetical protein
MRRFSFASLALVLGFFALTACKSGLGEHCQVDVDCEDGLVCGSQSSTCQEDVESTNDGGIDAAVDASETDAPTDAATDAAVDAAIDAAIDAP